MRYPKGQELQSLDTRDYRIIVIVCGSRKFYDKHLFHERLLNYLEDFDEPVLFVSGAAHSGADNMIIRWCKKFRYPCLEKPADWDKYQKRAGFIRNHEMGDMATHVLSFWDGVSPGTKDMIEYAEYKGLHIKIITIPKHENVGQKNTKNPTVSGRPV